MRMGITGTGTTTDMTGANARSYIHFPATMGARIADSVANAVGSWRFIIVQSILLALWILLNTLAFTFHWDGYPYILLNLMLSFQAAFTGPFVMLSQNRQSAKDRVRDDHEAAEITAMYENHALLLTLNEQQLSILHLLQEREGCTPTPS